MNICEPSPPEPPLRESRVKACNTEPERLSKSVKTLANRLIYT
jgi:hypothetical protein